MYLAVKEALMEHAPHTEERKNVIKSLGDYLSAFHEVRLVDKANNLAKERGSVLIYRDENGYFSFDLPDTPTTANKRLGSIVNAERALYKTIADGRGKALKTISPLVFAKEEEKIRYVQSHFGELLKNGYSLTDFKSIDFKKIKLIDCDCLLSAIAKNYVTLTELTDLTSKKLGLICQDEVIAAIEDDPNVLKKILSFSADKLDFLGNEQFLDLLENQHLSIDDIVSADCDELADLFEFNNLEKPLSEGCSLKELLDLHKKDANHIRWSAP